MNSILARAARQFVAKNARNYAVDVGHGASTGGHGGGYAMWKKLSFFIAVPAIGLGMLNAYLGHQEGDHGRPEFVPYPYMRVRTKRFPWGDGQKSLFHNPHVNALPDGYEDGH